MQDIQFKFDGNGLICAIAQDVYTGETLMQAYMNQEAIDKTLEKMSMEERRNFGAFAKSKKDTLRLRLRLFAFAYRAGRRGLSYGK